MTTGAARRAWRAAVLAAAIAAASPAPRAQTDAAPQAPATPLVVHITSPLGRTGTEGAVRIVARVEASPATVLQPVRFFVDGTLLGEDADGPPYAIEWQDPNPLERREIRVEVADSLGHAARDTVVLPPLEVEEHTEVLSVLVEATVMDAKGQYVNGIPSSGFGVDENGVPQKVDQVRPETAPTTYTLLVDASQSMSRRLDFVRDAASALTDYLKPADRIIVAPFSKHLEAITGPTGDRQTIGEAIEQIHSAGGTAIFDSLKQTAKLLDGVAGRHAIVLITDGYDEHSTGSPDDAIAAVQSAGGSVYVIGIGGVAGISLKGERLLRRVAAETGGRVFFPSREMELPAVHRLVAADVQSRYLLSYTPVDQKHDGTWRAITVHAGDPTFRIRARTGYFAPKPAPVRASIEFTLEDPERRILSLSSKDLEVVEDGVAQQVDGFEEALTPVSIMFALDTSGSMRKVVESVKAAARSFVQSVRPEDTVGMILFADRARFAHDLAKNRAWSLDAIDKYTASGGTALYDAVYDSLMRLRDVQGRRVVVVMTDGRDENNAGDGPGSTHTLDQVLDRLKSVEATVFAIGLGTKIDRETLERLARDSGGDAYFPEDVSTLPDQFHRIVETLRQRYVVSYTSSNSTRDGKWRAVEIHTRVPDTVVKSRGGYFAPEQ